MALWRLLPPDLMQLCACAMPVKFLERAGAEAWARVGPALIAADVYLAVGFESAALLESST